MFCFKQKTAYDMRISDWSSDVCSSDLELDQDKRLWLLPGERSKNGEEHLLPLSDLAMDEFKALGRKKRGLVLPCSTGKTPVSKFSDMKAALDKAMLPVLQELAAEKADAAGAERHLMELMQWLLHDIRTHGATKGRAPVRET